MAMLSNDDAVAGEGFNNNDFQLFEGYLFSKNDSKNHLNSML